MKTAVFFSNPSLRRQAEAYAMQLQVPLIFNDPTLAECGGASYDIQLIVTETHLALRLAGADSFNDIYVDFLGGALGYRCRQGGSGQQLLVRAVGLHKRADKHKELNVCDVTAGLGQDAFVLAHHGAQVIMVERSPIIAALLQDGLQRLAQASTITTRLQLKSMDAKRYLSELSIAHEGDEHSYPDVIYLDPMYPHTSKSALSKKEMRILRQVVGDDEDAEELLQLALPIAQKRVVVKRPRLAPIVPGPLPDFALTGKSSRFDVYLKK